MVRTHFAVEAWSTKRVRTACGKVVPDARGLGVDDASKIVCQFCYEAAKEAKRSGWSDGLIEALHHRFAVGG
jgi:hypothetical protein